MAPSPSFSTRKNSFEVLSCFPVAVAQADSKQLRIRDAATAGAARIADLFVQLDDPGRKTRHASSSLVIRSSP